MLSLGTTKAFTRLIMGNKSIRWRQRFHNFEKVFLLLKKTSEKNSLNEIERGGLIQFFEVAFELAWKTLKDYLEYEGIKTKGARDTIKQAFKLGIIDDGHTWLEALEDRNLTVHTYDQLISLNVEKLLKNKYFDILKKLYDKLRTEL